MSLQSLLNKSFDHYSVSREPDPMGGFELAWPPTKTGTALGRIHPAGAREMTEGQRYKADVSYMLYCLPIVALKRNDKVLVTGIPDLFIVAVVEPSVPNHHQKVYLSSEQVS